MAKIKYRLNKEIRKKISKPLGKVFSEEELFEFLKKKAARKRLKIIAVGDMTGYSLNKIGFEPDIWIYDGKIMRKRVKRQLPFPSYVVANPRSSITVDLCNAIDSVLKSKKKERIFVIGEEDLATLYLIFRAKDALVLYGQPGEGIVAIEVNKEIRKTAGLYLKEMDCSLSFGKNLKENKTKHSCEDSK
ncbi:MAG: DUF359 domain-containing protein [Candidatus Micrarchaeota archaeon]|nr:DUF359 domain-containing protein [Candidatus Micrarchaeota archaeon]